MKQLPNPIHEDQRMYADRISYNLNLLSAKFAQMALEVQAPYANPELGTCFQEMGQKQKERVQRQALNLLSNGVYVYDLAQIVDAASRLDMLLKVEQRLARLSSTSQNT